MSSNFGGGNNRGRGGNRGGRGRGGRGRGRGDVGANNGPKARFHPCRNFTKTGSCQFDKRCHNAHVVCSHAQIKLPIPPKSNNNDSRGYNGNYNNAAQNEATAVNSIAVWESQGTIKIFSGSKDGYWRLYNTNGFAMEFESRMGDGTKSRVECVEVASDYLFCGFESISKKLPNVTVGMIHAWNLKAPADPPLEFHMSPSAPFAHGKSVSSLVVAGQGAVISGSLDSTIRLWQFNAALEGGKGGFGLTNTLFGHVREVTSMVIIDTIMWSASTDKTIRLWDLGTGECKHLITGDTTNAQGNKVGHEDCVTTVLPFESEHGKFVLSGSLDGNIKAWRGDNGDCVASETHGAGVVCMALSSDPKGNALVLSGLDNGSIMIRNVLQTPSTPAFTLIVTLNANVLHFGHQNVPVKCLKAGPFNTFYSGGSDGQLIVWQITGDLEL